MWWRQSRQIWYRLPSPGFFSNLLEAFNSNFSNYRDHCVVRVWYEIDNKTCNGIIPYLNETFPSLPYSFSFKRRFVKMFGCLFWIIFKGRRTTLFFCHLYGTMRMTRWDFLNPTIVFALQFQEPNMASFYWETWLCYLTRVLYGTISRRHLR